MPKCSYYHTILFHLTSAKLKRKWPYIVLDLKKYVSFIFTQKKSANKYQIKQQIIYKNRYLSKQENSILKEIQLKYRSWNNRPFKRSDTTLLLQTFILSCQENQVVMLQIAS